MCAVFDDKGQQITELQGEYKEKEAAIKEAISKQEELPEINKQVQWKEKHGL